MYTADRVVEKKTKGTKRQPHNHNNNNNINNNDNNNRRRRCRRRLLLGDGFRLSQCIQRIDCGGASQTRTHPHTYAQITILHYIIIIIIIVCNIQGITYVFSELQRIVFTGRVRWAQGGIKKDDVNELRNRLLTILPLYLRSIRAFYVFTCSTYPPR